MLGLLVDRSHSGDNMAEAKRVTAATRVIGGLGGAIVGTFLWLVMIFCIEGAIEAPVELLVRESLICLAALGSVVGAVFPMGAWKTILFLLHFIC